MTAKNDITGDTITTKHTSDRYRDNFDAIFAKRVIFYFSDGSWCDRAELPYIASTVTDDDKDIFRVEVPKNATQAQVDAIVKELLS